MPFSRPGNYPHPREFKSVKDAQDYAQQMYNSLLERDSVDGATTKDIAQWESLTVLDYTSGKWILI